MLATSIAASAVAQVPPPVAAARDAAKQQFERGVGLMDKRDFEAALSAFQASLAQFKTKAATENAAECLRELGRLDESVAMFDRLLSDFPDAPAELRARVETARKSILAASGTLRVDGGEEGATLSVDGRTRGTLPLVAPVRLPTGAHTIRVHLEGYVPLVQTIDIVSGREASVKPKLEVLARAGRLRVKEKSGKQANLLIDGVAVGVTPWEGALAPGDHAVWLATLGTEGSAPKRAKVLIGQRTETVLELVDLEATLAVRVTPLEANVYIDGAPVGSGGWDGRLPRGSTELTVSSPGYVTNTRVVELGPGKASKVVIDLAAEPPAPTPPPPPLKPHWEVGFAGSIPLAPGMAAPSCADPCSATVPIGAHAEAQAGYRFEPGVGVGIAVGYLHIVESVEARPISLEPAGKPDQIARATDDLTLRGATLHAAVSLRLGNPWFVHMSAAGGAFVGVLRDERSLASVDSTGAAFRQGPYFSSGSVAGVSALATLGGGYRFDDFLEIWLGATGGVVAPLSEPAWSYSDPVPAGADGAAHLRDEDLLSSVIGIVAPSLGVSLSL